MAKNREFTEQEKQQLKNRYAETGLRQLSKEFHTSPENIRLALSEMGVALRKRGRPTSANRLNTRQSGILDESILESDLDDDLPVATRNFFELNND